MQTNLWLAEMIYHVQTSHALFLVFLAGNDAPNIYVRTMIREAGGEPT